MDDSPTVTRRQVLYGLAAVAGLLGATAATSRPEPVGPDPALQSVAASSPTHSHLLGVL